MGVVRVGVYAAGTDTEGVFTVDVHAGLVVAAFEVGTFRTDEEGYDARWATDAGG